MMYHNDSENDTLQSDNLQIQINSMIFSKVKYVTLHSELTSQIAYI